MNWGSLSNFLEMGGYARYVWGAYLVTLALITAEIVVLRVRRRRSMRDVRQAGRGSRN
jgi:heme exporter protein D